MEIGRKLGKTNKTTGQILEELRDEKLKNNVIGLLLSKNAIKEEYLIKLIMEDKKEKGFFSFS